MASASVAGGVCTTPPENPTELGITVGLHWFRAVTMEPVDDVLSRLAAALGESVEIRDGGQHGYSETYVLGQVKLWHNPARPDMGCCVEAAGEACDQLGPDGLLSIWGASEEWRISRVDLAVDGCNFTPVMVRDAWRGGDVDTRVKAGDPAAKYGVKAGREEWRRCEWSEEISGDLFGMGSRRSGQYARCYDRRGSTRFELELKRETAHHAGPLVMHMLGKGDGSFQQLTLQLIQRFVRFVDRSVDEKPSRCPELSWWAEFVQGVSKARLSLGQRVVRTVEEMSDWLHAQVAPTLAVVAQALGTRAVRRLLVEGPKRFGRRHREALALAGAPPRWRGAGAVLGVAIGTA